MACNTVLITGGTGSFGQTMVRAMLDAGAGEVRVFSRDESKQDAMRNRLGDDRVRYFIGDVRDRQSVERAIAGVDAVFHAAALKQVPSCEFFPMEAVRTNIVGSEHVIRAGIAAGVGSIVCLSTDKAVHPINAMGMSKAMMEKHAAAAARELGEGARTRISCVRYGNVMCSRGSVIPLFVEQIKAGRPITITDPEMTRFLMPLRDSVDLVRFAFDHARQGDLFIRKAPASTIGVLVEALLGLFEVPDHRVETIGWRHAEKLYETLASQQELARGEDLGEYWRIGLDERDLNYKTYFTQGDTSASRPQADFHSHNTERLDLAATTALLLSLPEIRAELAAWHKAREFA